jgi:hypothetical protein
MSELVEQSVMNIPVQQHPYPYYRALRENAPVRLTPEGHVSRNHVRTGAQSGTESENILQYVSPRRPSACTSRQRPMP